MRKNPKLPCCGRYINATILFVYQGHGLGNYCECLYSIQKQRIKFCPECGCDLDKWRKQLDELTE